MPAVLTACTACHPYLHTADNDRDILLPGIFHDLADFLLIPALLHKARRKHTVLGIRRGNIPLRYSSPTQTRSGAVTPAEVSEILFSHFFI